MNKTRCLCRLSVLVPFGHLHTKEYADHNYDDIQPNRKPILVWHMLHEAAKNHMAPCLGSEGQEILSRRWAALHWKRPLHAGAGAEFGAA